MRREERNYFNQDENTGEALNRFKQSLALGRKSYFDVSEFESIVELLLDEGDINGSEIAARQGMQIHPGAVPLKLKYAQVLLSQGKYPDALKYLEMAERVELTNPDVHLMKGTALLLNNHVPEAEKSFRKALKYSGSEKDDFLYHIGAAYIQDGQVSKAIKFFELALIENPENELALYDLGFYSDQEGAYQKSIDYYNLYLDIDPFNFSIWFNLGISYNKAGQFDKAIEAYEFALALNEDFDQPLFNIGNAYANAGKFSQAIDSYTAYLESTPLNDDAWCYLGECYLNLDDNERAAFHYLKAIDLNEENDTAWFGMGLLRWAEKKRKESIRCIRKALKIDDSNAEYWITLAKVYTENSQSDKAGKALIRAAELEGENPEIWLTWADLFLLDRETGKALEVLQTGMEKHPDSRLKYRMVGLLLESNREKDALEILQRAINQDFTQIDYLFEMYPKALKNRRLRKLVEDYRQKNNSLG